MGPEAPRTSTAYDRAMRRPADPLAAHFFTMAVNSAWANRRLLGAMAALPGGAFTAPTPSFFGSLSATANHLLTVDWFYVDALERAVRGEAPHARPGVFFEPEEPHPELASLRAAQEAVDQRAMDLTAGLDPDALLAPVRIRRRAGLATDSVTRVLAHLFQHQIHHRGQLHQLITAAGGSPPQLDELFCSADAPLRAAELAALGLTEASLFGD